MYQSQNLYEVSGTIVFAPLGTNTHEFHMPTRQWELGVKSSTFVGKKSGYLATLTTVSNVRVLPDDLLDGNIIIPAWATHILLVT